MTMMERIEEILRRREGIGTTQDAILAIGPDACQQLANELGIGSWVLIYRPHWIETEVGVVRIQFDPDLARNEIRVEPA